MTGVEILAVEEVVAESAFNYEVFGAAYFGAFVLFVIAGFVISIGLDDYSNMIVGVMFGLILGAMFGFIAGEIDSVPTAYENHYKVIISDEVPMNEFLEKYEIIDCEGKIYTVIERD